MKKVFTIKNYEGLVDVFKELKEEGFESPHVLTYKDGEEKRKDSMNRLQHHWLDQIAEQSGNSKAYERGYYKWTYGCPLLARDDDWFKENIYEKFMEDFTYEDVIDIMGTDMMAVTRLMSVSQMSEFLESMKQDANRRDIVLTDLQDIYYETVYGVTK